MGTTDQLISALCSTLVASLWEGLLLAAMAGLIILFTKNSHAVTRYNLLIAVLGLFAIATLASFILLYKGTSHPPAFTNLTGSPVAPNSEDSLTEHLAAYLHNYHNTLVLIWFLIICARSIQLSVGLWSISRLKKTKLFTLGKCWNTRLQVLAGRLGIHQMITLMELGLAKVPMVIGHLKPMILIPVGLVNALTAADVEAILVHELAHIKRRDYLVNLVQSLLEILFFFNPAVLWVSQLIKTERENCCDDLALQQSGNKLSYIHALLSCQEYEPALPAYAMGFPGAKNSLLDRVKRMADDRNHSLNSAEKGILAICLVCSGLCFTAFKERETIKRAATQVVQMIKPVQAGAAKPQAVVRKATLSQKQQVVAVAKSDSSADTVAVLPMLTKLHAIRHDTLNKEQKAKLAEQNSLLRKQDAMIRHNTALVNQGRPRLRAAGDSTDLKLKPPRPALGKLVPLVPLVPLITDTNKKDPIKQNR